jgi:hypothetical protein
VAPKAPEGARLLHPIHGSLPKDATRIVRQWALDHHEALMANRERGEAREPMDLIPGADADDD